MRLAIRALSVSLILAMPCAALSAPLHPHATVPSGQTYVFYKDGHLLNTVKSGKSWKALIARQFASDEINCIEIECPAGLPKGAHCWRCTG